MAKQIIVTQNDYGIELETQFVNDKKKPLDITGYDVKVKIIYNDETIDTILAEHKDSANGIACIVLEKKHLINAGLHTSVWSVVDEDEHVTAQEDLFYFVKETKVSSDNNDNDNNDNEDIIEEDKITIVLNKLSEISEEIKDIEIFNANTRNEINTLKTEIPNIITRVSNLEDKNNDITNIKSDVKELKDKFDKNIKVIFSSLDELEEALNNTAQCTTINLHVNKDGSGDFTSLVDCVKSITDSSLKKQYNIYVYDDHDIIDELGGQNYIESLPDSADRTSLYIPEYVNIIGIGLRIISGKIEKSWNCNYNAIKAMSTLEIKKGNNKFKNLIITAQNMRYAVHDESNGSVPNNSVEWENCKFIHYGNDDFKDDNTGQWLSVCGYGSGMSSGCIRKFEQCYFESNAFFPFSCHDNKDFKDGVYLYFNDCELNNKGGKPAYSQSAKLSTYGSGTVDNTASFNNCILKNILVKSEISSENLNRWRVKTCGNVTDYIAKSNESVPHTISI